MGDPKLLQLPCYLNPKEGQADRKTFLLDLLFKETELPAMIAEREDSPGQSCESFDAGDDRRATATSSAIPCQISSNMTEK